jgi:hypothetical protein
VPASVSQDVAQAMLAQLEDDTYLRQMPMIST